MMNRPTHANRLCRRRPGLRQEILLTLVFLLGATLLFGGVLFLRYAEQSLLDSHLRQLVQVTRLAAGGWLPQDTPRQVPQLLQPLRTELSAEAWWFYNRDLQLVDSLVTTAVSAYSPVRLRSLLQQPDTLLEVDWPGLLGLLGPTEEPLAATVASSVGNSVSPQGVLVVRFSLQPLRAQLLEAQRWVFLYALGYGLILTAAGYLLLRRNVIRPVKNLLQATEKVTAGDLETVLEVKGPAEIADLAESFNSMTSALRHSRQQTDAHIHSLSETNTELRNTQEQLIRSEKLATVGHLAAGMAHEIGNPLGALTGYLGLLQSELPDGHQRDFAAHAAYEAERIDRLVRDLLDYAAPGQPDPQPVAPWPVVLETVEMLNAQGALKGIQLELDADPTLPPVAIARHKLAQVLVNLLLNARDACVGGGRIDITGQLRDGRVLLGISDNGVGMSAQVRQQLFEPFFTTKPPGAGRGLGLAVCQRVVTEAGGSLSVTSNAGDGSCFDLTLPMAGGTHD